MSRPLDRRDRRAVVITEIAVTIAIVIVVGSAVFTATATITAIAAQAKESHQEVLQTVKERINQNNSDN